VIIFNEGQEGRTSAFQGTLSEPQFSLPAVGASFAVGEALAALPEDALLHMVVDAFVDERAGVNVFAEREGCDESVLMIGAHLDSVAAGPGMNDNGSGSATVLELAVQMAVQKISPRRTVRFAWWTAEELGLIGSDFYVNTLPPDDLARIAYYLNFDMVGSPNFVRFVYDGDGTSGGYVFPTGSEAIEYLFRDYFTELNLPVEELALTASDNFPFAEVGVPVGGLFTGAGGLKTAEEANIYGGQADIAYDPCYHLACDDFDNVNLVALDQMSDAAAHALLSLAQDSSFCLSETFASAAWFVQCMAGPTVEVGACCLCSDLNGNHTVSLDDFAEWQNRFGGSP
jgi:hypothetical protein